MAQIQVVILDPQGSPKGIELPDDVPVKHMLPQLTEALGFGEGCALYNRTQLFWYNDIDSLRIRDTREGDTLRLMLHGDE